MQLNIMAEKGKFYTDQYNANKAMDNAYAILVGLTDFEEIMTNEGGVWLPFDPKYLTNDTLLETIEDLINHYEYYEEYEKCEKLLKLKKDLNNKK